MKKQAVATFANGLNYDLNPITTPDNILTDCVNGTTITYNGDELALQNDSGNTKILIPGETDKYVQLSDGFYPLGIKEYGGVLYIVSSCRAFNEWDSTITYPINTKIYLSSTQLYYISNKSTTGSSPDLLVDWVKYTLTDAEKLLEKVEFGSYPSPERPADENKGVISSTITETLNTEISASSAIKFQAGVDVKFTHALDDVYDKNYITTYDSNGNKVSRKLYDIKLYHKLGSGLIDLTGYVNSKSALANKLWFENNEITYKCYNNYKGTLISKVELEKINKFELSQEITYNSELGDLTFTFNHDSGCSVLIKGFVLNYTIDNEPSVQKQVYFSELTNDTYVLDLSPRSNTSLLSYTIFPILTYLDLNSEEIRINNDEIKDYILEYTLSGVTTLFSADLNYSLVPTKHVSLNNFNGGTKMVVLEWMLMDKTETNYLNPNLTVSTTNKYGFVDANLRDNWETLYPNLTKPTFYATHLLGEFDHRSEHIGDLLRSYITNPNDFPTVDVDIIYNISSKTSYIDNYFPNNVENVVNITRVSGNSNAINITSTQNVSSDLTVGLMINNSTTTIYVTILKNTSTIVYNHGANISSASITSLSPAIDGTYTYIIGLAVGRTSNEISVSLNAGVTELTVSSEFPVKSAISCYVSILELGVTTTTLCIIPVDSSSVTNTITTRTSSPTVWISLISPQSDWKYNYIGIQ